MKPTIYLIISIFFVFPCKVFVRLLSCFKWNLFCKKKKTKTNVNSQKNKIYIRIDILCSLSFKSVCMLFLSVKIRRNIVCNITWHRIMYRYTRVEYGDILISKYPAAQIEVFRCRVLHLFVDGILARKATPKHTNIFTP